MLARLAVAGRGRRGGHRRRVRAGPHRLRRRPSRTVPGIPARPGGQATCLGDDHGRHHLVEPTGSRRRRGVLAARPGWVTASYVERYFGEMPAAARLRTPMMTIQVSAAGFPRYAARPDHNRAAEGLLRSNGLGSRAAPCQWTTAPTNCAARWPPASWLPALRRRPARPRPARPRGRRGSGRDDAASTSYRRAGAGCGGARCAGAGYGAGCCGTARSSYRAYRSCGEVRIHDRPARQLTSPPSRAGTTARPARRAGGARAASASWAARSIPIHHGHLVAASEVASRFLLDEVVFVPDRAAVAEGRLRGEHGRGPVPDDGHRDRVEPAVPREPGRHRPGRSDVHSGHPAGPARRSTARRSTCSSSPAPTRWTRSCPGRTRTRSSSWLTWSA